MLQAPRLFGLLARTHISSRQPQSFTRSARESGDSPLNSLRLYRKVIIPVHFVLSVHMRFDVLKNATRTSQFEGDLRE